MQQDGLIQEKKVCIDATRLEANAALKNIVHGEAGQSCKEYLKGLAKSAGLEGSHTGTVGAAGPKTQEEGCESGVEEHQRP